jgi:hypothetical protein
MSAVPMSNAEAAAPFRYPPGAGYRRAVSVAALIATPVLAAVSEVLQPSLGSDATQRLASMSGVLPGASAVAFLVGQLPMMVAVLAIGHLLRQRHPRLSSWGTSLAFLGAFGHTVFGGLSLVWLAMANDGTAHRDVYAHLLDQLMNSPVMVFSLAGLAGTVLGVLLLSIGLFRGRIGPRWVGPALWAFLVVEFAGTSLSPSAAYLSILCFAAPLIALAVHTARQPLHTWAE